MLQIWKNKEDQKRLWVGEYNVAPGGVRRACIMILLGGIMERLSIESLLVIC